MLKEREKMKNVWKKAILPLATISLASLLLINTIPETQVQAESKVQTQLQIKKNALPLGTPNLHEQRTFVNIAPGLTYTKINRGATSAKDFFTVDVAFVETHKQAQALLEKLKEDGFKNAHIIRE